MTEAVNPYREWLGIDTDAPQLNYYELLELNPFESDSEAIHRAADRALAKVRSHRPGPHAAAWAQLLDTLAQAKKCLTNPARKATYDNALRQKPKRAAATGAEQDTTAAEIATVNQLPDLFPPGMAPSSPGTTAAAGDKVVARPAPGSHSATASPASPDAVSEAAVDEPVRTKTLARRPSTPQPPPAPEPTATEIQRAVPLLSDPFENAALGGVRLSELTPSQPVNAHVAPPEEDKSSLLPMLLGVVLAVTIITFAVGFLALRGTFTHSIDPPPSLPAPVNPGGQDAENASAPPFAPPAAPASGPAPALTPPAINQQAATVPAQVSPPDHSSAGESPGLPSTSGLSWNAASAAAAETSPPVAPQVSPPQPHPGTTPANDGSAQHAPQDDRAASAPATPTQSSQPTPEELAQLSQSLVAAHVALTRHEFAQANRELDAAAQLARRPEHKRMVAGLQQLSQHSARFWQTVASAMEQFQGAEELTVGAEGLVVLVVQTGGDWITVRKEGRNLRYSLAEMPPGLALAIAKTRLNTNDPAACLQLGACLATTADRKASYLDEARKYWNQAAAAGVAIELLLTTLTDTYDVAD